MTEEHKKYEKKIKRKYSFGWTPTYEEEVKTYLNEVVFAPVIVKTFEKLGWDIVYQDETQIEANRTDKWEKSHTERIVVTYKSGRIIIKSTSLKNNMWDFGRNSKRVKLFIFVFKEIESNYDRKELKELEITTTRAAKMDDYYVPETLLQPGHFKEPNFYIPIIGGVVVALLLGYIVAYLSNQGLYFIGAFEVGVGLMFGVVFKYLIKFSNYSNYTKLDYLLIGLVVTTYVSNQFFQYNIFLGENQIDSLSFVEFMKLRFQNGLTIDGFNLGWIGLVVSWILQLVLTYAVGIIRISSIVTLYVIEKVPKDVVDFAVYHMVKNKTERQIRTELSKKGWVKEQDQDDVFTAINWLNDVREMNKSV